MKLVIAIRSQALTAMLMGFSARLLQNLNRTLNRLSLEIQSWVKGQKLSGQVLHVRTGTLRRSINRRVEMRSDGVWAIIGTNVEYGAVHEYGYKGPQTIKAHLRMMRVAFGRPVKDPRQIMVGQHTRQVNLPERSFLRSSLRDFEQRAQAAIQRAAAEALA